MALCQQWRDAEPVVLSRCIGEGLRALGYTSVKPEHLEAIQCVLKGEDMFVSVQLDLESLMFQILPICARNLLVSSGCTDLFPLVLVISPLIALMQDQVSKLNRCSDVDSTGVTRSLINESSQLLEPITHLYGSPKAVLGSKIGHVLLSDARFSSRVMALAINEAHCIMKW